MTTWIISSIVLTVILSISTYIAIWSRKPTNARLLALVLLVPLSLLAVGANGINLGNPSRCYAGYNIPTGKLDILGFKVIKDDIIYLMLDTGGREPFTCSVPYNTNKAESLEGNKRAGNKSKLLTKGGGTPGQSIGTPDDGIILADPVPALPDKPQRVEESIDL